MTSIGSPDEQDGLRLGRHLLAAARHLIAQGRADSLPPLAAKAIELDTSSCAPELAFDLAIQARRLDLARHYLSLARDRAGVAGDPEALGRLEKATDALWRRFILPESLDELLSKRSGPTFDPIRSRICYVLNSSLPYVTSGYTTRSEGVALGLSAAGFEVICLTRPGFPMDTELVQASTVVDPPPIEEVGGVTYQRIFAPTRKTRSPGEYVFAATKALTARMQELRPEVVIAASNYLSALPAQMAARALGIPFIYEVRGFWEITRASHEPSFEGSAYFREQVELETLTARHADRVFTLNQAMREELVQRGVATEKVSLFPNSCDPSRFTPRPRDEGLASRLGIPPDVPVIGFVGSITPYEGLDDLVAACDALCRQGLDFRLLLVGGESATRAGIHPVTDEIRRLAGQGCLGSRLIMPGRVPHHEVEAYYSLIDIAPFPRKPLPVTEIVSPLKPLEAMAAEKAVLVSSVRALSEMVIDGQTGLVFAKGSREALTRELERLLVDPEFRGTLARAGRDWVLRNRTWEKSAQAAKREIEAALAGGRQPDATIMP